MRAVPSLSLVMLVALVGCVPSPPSGTTPVGRAAFDPGALPSAPARLAAPILHDGGIVFAQPPAGSFAVGGRLPAPVVHDGGIVFSRLPAYRLQQGSDRLRVRLTLASGRTLLTTPDGQGVFRFVVKPRGGRNFGVVSLRIERESGSTSPITFGTGAGRTQAWAKLPAGGSYDLGPIMLDERESQVANNPLARLDADGDGTPDAEDQDDDGDRVADAQDQGAFSYDPDENHDRDRDGVGDNRDSDDDNDGVADANDQDDDGDGIPDAQDPDDDNDGVPDASDLRGRGHDLDHDGLPDEADTDDDGDGIPDALDPDDDNDGLPDASDLDDDDDGVPDAGEATDRDGDGVADFFDPSPADPSIAALPAAFDWVAFDRTMGTDTDNDGLPDARDLDDDGDGVPDAQDTDDDGDGVPDAEDRDSDGNGLPDADEASGPDTDGDGLPDALDTDDDNDGRPEGPIDVGPWRNDTDGDGVVDGVDRAPGDEGDAESDHRGANRSDETSYGEQGAEDDEELITDHADPTEPAVNASPDARPDDDEGPDDHPPGEPTDDTGLPTLDPSDPVDADGGGTGSYPKDPRLTNKPMQDDPSIARSRL